MAIINRIPEYFQTLYHLPNDLAWKLQAPISLLIHRFQHVALQPGLPQQTWIPGSQGTEMSEQMIVECLQLLYNIPDGDLQQYQATVLYHILPRFGRLPYVQALKPGPLQCQTFLISVCQEISTTASFYGYVWTRLIVDLSRKGDPQIQALRLPWNPSLSDLFIYVMACRHHGIAYKSMFPGAPLTPESGDRLATHVSAYVNACGWRGKQETTNALKFGRKLVALEDALECPGITLVLFVLVRKLDMLNSRDIHQLIWLLGIFGQFPKVMDLAHSLTPDVNCYQRRFSKLFQ